MNITGLGYNQSINNYYNRNNSCRMRNNSPQFKGTVAPEFVDYVNKLRNDSLETAKGEKYKESINAMADNIINTAEDTMQNYFHPDVVLTVDSTKCETDDAIVCRNNLLKLTSDYCLQHSIAYVGKSWSAIHGLNKLNALTNDYMFIQAINMEVHSLKCSDYYLKRWDDENSFNDAVKNTKEVLEWNHNNGPHICEKFQDLVSTIDDAEYEKIKTKLESVEKTKKW